MEIYRELYQTSKDLPEFTIKARRLHKLMKQEDWQEQFDKFWGERIIGYPADAGKVFVDSDNKLEIPRLKNFIQSLIDQQKAELLEKLTLEQKKGQSMQLPCPDGQPGCLVIHYGKDLVKTERDYGYNQAVQDLEQLKQQL